MPHRLLARPFAPLRRLARNTRGNVIMLFAFALLPMTFATGMGIDYARAMRLQTKCQAAADAAALAAVSKSAMGYSSAIATYAAQQVFTAQIQSLFGSGGLTITSFIPLVTDSTNNTTTKRVATVSFTGTSSNAFAELLGMNTLTIRGTSTSTASTAPNIDFYVMMDVSQSMLLPATTNDLNTMIAATGGCAFACHVTGSTNDNYAIARNNKLQLRADLVSTAVANLTTTASKMASTNNANYRMGLFDFDYAFRNIWPTSRINGYYADTSMSTVNSHVADAQVTSYCSNNVRVCGTSDNDTDTDFTTAMTTMNSEMPAPGNGTNVSGDKPQAILFIITDGMRDEAVGGNPGARTMGPIPQSLCDTIKGNNIRIAILYTEYLPSSASDQWSIDNVKTPFLSPTDNISPALTSCASSGLYYKVTTDDDVSSALATLFQQAVATAHLTH